MNNKIASFLNASDAREVGRLFDIFVTDFHSDKEGSERLTPYRTTVRTLSTEGLNTLIKDTTENLGFYHGGNRYTKTHLETKIRGYFQDYKKEYVSLPRRLVNKALFG